MSRQACGRSAARSRIKSPGPDPTSPDPTSPDPASPDPASPVLTGPDLTHQALFCHRLSRTDQGLAALVAAACLRAGEAWAAGSNMPWETPLQAILDSVEGPVARIIAVIIIIITGLSLAFGDTAGGFRRLIQIVFGLSIAFAATSFFLTFFSFGGGALIP